MRCPNYCGWSWSDGWVFAGAVNFPCVMHNYPPPQFVFNDKTKILVFDRVLTEDEVQEIYKRWIESEDI